MLLTLHLICWTSSLTNKKITEVQSIATHFYYQECVSSLTHTQTSLYNRKTQQSVPGDVPGDGMTLSLSSRARVKLVAKDTHSLRALFHAQDGFRTHQALHRLLSRHIDKIHSHSVRMALPMNKVHKYLALFPIFYTIPQTRAVTYRCAACPRSPALGGFILSTKVKYIP